MKEYNPPKNLIEKYGQDFVKIYKKWLDNKAAALHKRDRNDNLIDPKIIKKSHYKLAINKAIHETNGRCFYSNLELDWDKISTYKNEKIPNLPTIDHVDRKKFPLKLVLCSWKINDMKSDMSVEEFLYMCEIISKNAFNIKNKL